ncbi:MAG: AI-2E family transporter [Acidobacteriales bacterium]|nr:AI-2E family transporter [Terriglobales bacterium]
MAVVSRTWKSRETRSFSALLIALSGFIAVLYFGQLFFITLLVSTVIALILEPFVDVLVRAHLPRTLASFLVCSVALLLLYLAGLGFYTQASGLIEDLPNYSQKIHEISDAVVGKVESMERATYEVLAPKRLQEKQKAQEQARAAEEKKQADRRKRRAAEPLNLPEPPSIIEPAPVPEVRIRPERSPIVDYVYSNARAFYQAGLMASFVPFLVYFMLSWRDHIYRGFLRLFHEHERLAAGRSMQGIAAMVRAFVAGNFMLGVLLALISSLLFWILRLPYFLLVGPLSGFLSLIPYIGLPLALVPPVFAALTVYSTLTPYLILATVVSFLHLLALNLLYPKVVGSRVHLNPLVVTVALMGWATLWGAAGLMLAIPITAAIKAVCDNVESLQAYGKLLGD